MKIYHRLPTPLRKLAARFYGWHLQRLRYDRQTPSRVDAALALERWPRVQIDRWVQQQIDDLLAHARRSVPWYRTHAPSGPAPLSAWPIVDRQMLRQAPRSFLAAGIRQRRIRIRTSGTTGTPLTVAWSKQDLRGWFALLETRLRRWVGVQLDTPWALFGGKMVVPPSRTKPPFHVWNAAMRQVYVSTYHLRPDWISSVVAALRRHNVRYLLGYTSSLVEFARCVEATGETLPPLAAIITNAEPCRPWQRRILGRVCGCTVRETWGMAEGVAGASECEAGRMHLWPDAGLVEIVDDDGQPLPPGESGRIVCTGFLNRTMPLIRYAIGDTGAIAAEQTCPCGRTLPIIETIAGRSNDLVTTPDGRRLFQFDPVFHELPIAEGQIEQLDTNHVVVRFVPDDRTDVKNTAATIRSRVAERLGTTMSVQVEAVTRIPREPNGKLRQVISRVSDPDPAGSGRTP